MFWIFGQYRLIQGQRDLNTGFSKGRIFDGRRNHSSTMNDWRGAFAVADHDREWWGLWQCKGRRPSLEGAAASQLHPLLPSEIASSVLPNLPIFFFQEKPEIQIFIWSPVVFITWQLMNLIFLNASQAQCYPMGCWFRVFGLFNPCFPVGSRAPEKSSALWCGWRLCSLVPTSTKPGLLWLIWLCIWRNNKSLGLNKSTLRVICVSPSSGFPFLLSRFDVAEAENAGPGSQLCSHHCVTLGEALVSPLCLLSHRFSFLPASLSLSLLFLLNK